MITCKNCEFEFEGKFCNNCGQKAKTERLDWKYVSDEAKYTFLHFNGGFAHTCKELFTRPGDSIREFIEGKRVGHYKPLLFLFVLAGIYGILAHYINIESLIPNVRENAPNALKMQRKIQVYFTEISLGHYSIVELILLPLNTIASWLAFRKWGYNFIEHLILNSFMAAQRLVLNIVIFPIFLLIPQASGVFLLVSALLGFGAYAVTIWTFITFFRGRDLGQIILRILLYFVIFFVLFVIVLIAIAISYSILHPELIESLRPKN